MASEAGAAPSGVFESVVPGTRRNPWGQEALSQTFPRLESDIRCDVCVVGGGIAGLTTAYHLARAGKHVVVLEGRAVGSGRSGTSIGTLSDWHSGLYREVERALGSEGTQHAAAAHAAAIDFVSSVVQQEGIECGLHVVPGYVVAAEGGEAAAQHAGLLGAFNPNGQAGAALHAEFNACARAGLVGARLEVVASPTTHMTPSHHAAPRTTTTLPTAITTTTATTTAGFHPSSTTSSTSSSSSSSSSSVSSSVSSSPPPTSHALAGPGAAPTTAAPAGPITPPNNNNEKEVLKVMGKSATAVAPGLAPTTAAALGLSAGLVSRALVVGRCASLDPVKYCSGLARAVQAAGGLVYEFSKAQAGLVTGPRHGEVQVLGGGTVHARDAVVYATHSPINRDQLWVHNRQLAYRTYVIGLTVPHGAIRGAHFYSVGRPNLGATLGTQHMARVAHHPEDPSSDLLLVEGGAHLHGLVSAQYTAGRGDPWSHLEAWARSVFPAAAGAPVAYRWSSSAYAPSDLLGLYGRDPFDYSDVPVYILSGHGGQEVTGATIGGGVVAGAILGHPPPWASTYAPSRFAPRAILRYGSELTTYFSIIGLALAKHIIPLSLTDLIGLVAPERAESTVRPGDGAVLQHGLRKKALYRDEGGTLHVRSAVCTHLGCCVAWNPLDRTFDCPCHGSAYDADGRCIHGPGVGDLEDLAGPVTPLTGRVLQAGKALLGK